MNYLAPFRINPYPGTYPVMTVIGVRSELSSLAMVEKYTG